MAEKEPIDLGKRISLIDGYDSGLPERTGIYVIHEEELTLVETGPSPSVPYIRAGLHKLGYTLDQVKYIVLTHIHLDHAGGAGLLLQECPQASIVVHPKAVRHIVDPSRLVAGAKAVYGEQFDSLFAPIVPVPQERVIAKQDGETLQIGPACALQFFDTPGHANHHFSIYDPVSNGMFTGDTAGVHYYPLASAGIPFFLPSTSPNQFDPNKMASSIARYREMNLDRLYFGHYGMTEQLEEAYSQVLHWLPLFVAEGEKARSQGQSHEELRDRLLALVKEALQQRGVGEEHEVFSHLRIDLSVCAMGIMDYLEKKDAAASQG